MALETAISVNITAQLLSLTGMPEISKIPVLDSASLPSFKVEKKNSATSAAVLNTVKIVCAIERGLEALVAALQIGRIGEGKENEEGEQAKGLMEVCLTKPEAVGMEMQSAVEGMRKVLKSKAPH